MSWEVIKLPSRMGLGVGLGLCMDVAESYLVPLLNVVSTVNECAMFKAVVFACLFMQCTKFNHPTFRDWLHSAFVHFEVSNGNSTDDDVPSRISQFQLYVTAAVRVWHHRARASSNTIRNYPSRLPSGWNLRVVDLATLKGGRCYNNVGPLLIAWSWI